MGIEVILKIVKIKKVNDFKIKHFQLHDFSKIILYIIEGVLNLKSK